MTADTNKKLELIQHSLNIIGTSFALLLHLFLSKGLPIPWYAILLSLSFVYALLTLWDSNKTHLLPYLLLIPAFLLGLWQGILHSSFLLGNAWEIGSWFLNGSLEQSQAVKITTVQLFMLLLFLSTSVTLLLFLLNKNRHLRFLNGFLILAYLIYGGIYGPDMNKVSLALLLTVIMEELLAWNNLLKQKKQNINHGVNTLYLLPICILIGILPVLFPSKEEPIQWNRIRAIGGFVQERMEELAYYAGNLIHPPSDEYALQFVGYQDGENSFLSGDVQQSNRNILQITPSERPRNDIYLTGNVYPVYTSTGWKKDSRQIKNDSADNTPEFTMDMAELLYGIYRNNVTPQEGETLFHSLNLDIKYQFLRTRSLFYPAKTYQIRMPIDPVSYDDTSAALLASNRIKKGFSYEVNYLELNLGSPTLQQYFRDQSRTARILGTTSALHPSISFHQYLDDALKLYLYKDERYLIEYRDIKEQRTADIYSDYVSIPTSVPQRVYDLAHEITAPYDNQYDQLRAIENYLSTYTYTLSPKTDPDGTDFVDSFLFETKSGYCTHFATSMAILARCVGIPTRYVEGVWVDHNTEHPSFYQVKSSASHAWVDAYINGVGWIPFEPTYGMQQNRYTPWRLASVKDTTTEMTSPLYTSASDTSSDLTKVQTFTQKVHLKFMFQLSLLILFLLVLFFLLVYLGLHHAKRKRFLHSTKAEQIHSLMVDILYLLEMIGYQLQPSETLQTFEERICVPLPVPEDSLTRVFLTYEKYRYSDYLPSDAERDAFSSYKDALMMQIKSSMPAWKRIFFYFRHLLDSLRSTE